MKQKIKQILGISILAILTMGNLSPFMVATSEKRQENISLDVNNSNNPFIVTFGNTKEEKIAVSTLLENFPNAKIIDFSMIHQILNYDNPIIYVGHGSSYGLDYFGRIIEWDYLADIITASKSNNHYILECESKRITELEDFSGKKVISFASEIDAEFAALYVSFMISNNKGLLKHLIYRINEIMEGAEQFTLSLGKREKSYHMFNLIVLALGIILPIVMSNIPSNVLVKSFLHISAYTTTLVLFKTTIDFFFSIAED